MSQRESAAVTRSSPIVVKACAGVRMVSVTK
jgi:hypothetical protein